MCVLNCVWLCSPIDCRLPGSSVHGIFQAKNTGVGCHFLLQGTFPTQGLNLFSWVSCLAGWFFTTNTTCCCSVTKSCPALQSHGLQHTRLPCSSLSHGVCSDLCPLSQWCCPAISCSVTPFSSCPQSFLAPGNFPMSWLCTSGGQTIGVWASVLPVNIQGWFPLGLTGLISSLSKGLWRVFSNTTTWNHQFFVIQPSLWFNSYISHDYWKNHSFDYSFVSKVMSLLFNMLSRFVIAFFPSSLHLLIL